MSILCRKPPFLDLESQKELLDALMKGDFQLDCQTMTWEVGQSRV